MQSGLALKLSYKPRQTQLFYQSIFQLPFDTRKCPVDAFISLDSEKQMNSFSFYTDCLEILYDKLLFQNLVHRVYFPGTQQDICNQPNNFTQQFPNENFGLVIHSSIRKQFIDTGLPLGIYFQLMQSTETADISIGFKSTSADKVSLLYSVQVKILDTSFTVPVTLDNGAAVFVSSCDLFSKDFYHATVAGRANTQSASSWNSLIFELSGWFSRTDRFLQALQRSVHSGIDLRAKYAFRRKSAAEEQRNRSTMSFNQIKLQLENAKVSFRNSTERYHRATDTFRIANETLKEANEAVANRTNEVEELQRGLDDVCQLENCPSQCIPVTRTRTVYKDEYITVLGICESSCNVTVQIRVSPFTAPTTVWRFTQICNDVEVTCAINDFCLRTENECRWVCKSVPTIKPVYNYRPKIEEQLCYISCNKSVYSTTIETTENYVDNCAQTAPELTCTARNKKCEESQETSLNIIERKRQDLVRPIRTRNTARRERARAEIEFARAKQAKDIAEDALNAARVQFALRERVENASYQNYLRIVSVIGDDLKLYELTKGYNASNIVNIFNMTFTVMLRGVSPVVFPINIIYESLPSQQQFVFTALYDFMQDFETQKNSLVDSIIDDIISNNTATRRRKRAEHSVMNAAELQFEIRCAELISVSSFLQYLQESLFEAMSKGQELVKNLMELLHSFRTLMNSVDNVPTGVSNYTRLKVLFNISQYELDSEPPISFPDDALNSIVGMLDDLQSTASDVVAIVNQTVFNQWQSEIGTLLLSEGAIGDKYCYGFSDCLQILTSLLEDVLSFAPDNVASKFQSLLPPAVISLQQVATFTNLTVEAVIDLLEPVLSIVDEMNMTGYWCAKPPEILSHPVSEKNVSVGDTLILTCLGSSVLSFTYQWRKDGVVISGTISPTLNLSNFQVFDEGNYTCEITNAVKTVWSTNASVHGFILPEFYLEPVSVVTYIGSSNGAHFTCNATSRPDPGWKWLFSPTLEDDGSKWQELIGEDINELIIAKPNRTHEGFYKCLVYNDFGDLRSEPVLLKLVSASSRAFSLQLEFTMTSSNRSEQKRQTEVEESIETLILNSINNTIDFELVSIRELILEFSSDKKTIFVYFVLVSANTTTPNMIQESLAEIVQRQSISKEQLNTVQTRLQEYFRKRNLNVTSNGRQYTSKRDSMVTRSSSISCPRGQGLRSNRFLCSK